ncbi:MAG: AAA family ATPase [Nanoarchaeota archaeon]|nr:AAA family ATPase [Nanoarchaeota archaeon]
MWYKKYGWKENPFFIKYNTDIVGFDNEKDKILDYVNSGDICIVIGRPGVGKTSLLKWLQKKLKRYKVFYLSAEGLPEFYSLSKNIKKSFFKKNVLLLDEAQLSDENLKMELKMLWDTNVLKSVVIAQTHEGIKNYSESFKERVGKRVLRLRGINSKSAFELINRRTKDKNPFDENMVKLITDDAKQNPRRILENCELLCIELQNEELKQNQIKEILKNKKTEELFDLIKLEEPKIPDNLMPIDEEKLKDFSPMQKRLIMVLLEGHRTTKQLSKILNSSEGSVGKQLSKLAEKAVVIIINHRRPKVYGLAKNFKAEI